MQVTNLYLSYHHQCIITDALSSVHLFIDVIRLISDLHLPKPELNTKNSTERPPICGLWPFGRNFDVQLDSLKRSDPARAKNGVELVLENCPKVGVRLH